MGRGRPGGGVRGSRNRGSRQRHAGPQRGAADISSALEEGMHHFLHPVPRKLAPVPLQFVSPQQWASIIAHNLLAEFYCSVADRVRGGPSLKCEASAGDELRVLNPPEPSMMQCLLACGSSFHYVTNQTPLPDGSLLLKCKPAPKITSRVKSLGYIGSYVAEHATLVELAQQSGRQLPPVLRSILEPRKDIHGDFVTRDLRPEFPINPSQRKAVYALQYALENIQGPPGTGKSTTVFHVITSRLPPDAIVLVTCSRNVAVESIAQKLKTCSPGGLLIFGNAERIGETAHQYLMDKRAQNHGRAGKAHQMLAKLKKCAMELRDALKHKEAKLNRAGGPLWSRAWRGFIRHRYLRAALLCRWCENLQPVCELMAEQMREEAKIDILLQAKILLCTIASTTRMIREYEERIGQPLQVHTVIVDECGCTPESSTGLLLKLRPQNLILVGDHKQLPPCSMIPPNEVEETGHTRSLLERAILGSGRVHRLTEQYRMPAPVCKIVSKLFYGSLLRTPEAIAIHRAKLEKCPLVWTSVRGSEETLPGQNSIVNRQEIRVAVAIASDIRRRHGDEPSIAILTFYKGQTEELLRSVRVSENISVLTVDSCQGSEFDYVVLSTVRSNGMGKLGFVKDRQRINVAISRTVIGLHIVGNDACMSSADEDWSKIVDAATIRPPLQSIMDTSYAPALEETLWAARKLARDEKAHLMYTESQQSDREPRAFGVHRKPKNSSRRSSRSTEYRNPSVKISTVASGRVHKGGRSTKVEEKSAGLNSYYYSASDFPGLASGSTGSQGNSCWSIDPRKEIGNSTCTHPQQRRLNVRAADRFIRHEIGGNEAPLQRHTVADEPIAVLGESTVSVSQLIEIFNDEAVVMKTLREFNNDTERTLNVLLESDSAQEKQIEEDFDWEIHDEQLQQFLKGNEEYWSKYADSEFNDTFYLPPPPDPKQDETETGLSRPKANIGEEESDDEPLWASHIVPPLLNLGLTNATHMHTSEAAAIDKTATATESNSNTTKPLYIELSEGGQRRIINAGRSRSGGRGRSRPGGRKGGLFACLAPRGQNPGSKEVSGHVPDERSAEVNISNQGKSNKAPDAKEIAVPPRNGSETGSTQQKVRPRSIETDGESVVTCVSTISDTSVARLVEMGFAVDRVSQALEAKRYSFDEALQLLLSESEARADSLRVPKPSMKKSTADRPSNRTPSNYRTRRQDRGVYVPPSQRRVSKNQENKSNPKTTTAGAQWDRVTGGDGLHANDKEVSQMVHNMFEREGISDRTVEDYVASMLQLSVREKQLDEENLGSIIDIIVEQGVSIADAQTGVQCIVARCRD